MVSRVGRSACVAVIVSLALVGPVAPSGAAGLPSDPSPDSPSGTVYALPLDSARRDAAPRTAPGQGGRSHTGETNSEQAGYDSAIRSENNFGSSSDVPGVGATGAGSAASGAEPATSGAAAAQDRRSGGSSAQSQTGSDTAGGADGDVRFSNASSTDEGSGPSEPAVLALLGAVVLVGAGLGAVAGRRADG
jgi:hypothetical protein